MAETKELPQWLETRISSEKYQKGFQALGWHMEYEERAGIKYCVYYLPDGSHHSIPYNVVFELAKLEQFSLRVFNDFVAWAGMLNHPD